MRVLSFFSGIGGLELGLPLAEYPESAAGWLSGWSGGSAGLPGHSPAGFVENNKFALSVLAKRWPGAPAFRDVNSVGPGDLPTADAWCRGFPCQDISMAGRGVGIHGDRSGLFFRFAELAKGARPRVVVMENVAALLCRGLDDVLAEMVEADYDAEWDCVPASAFGAPHMRDRIFLVCWDASRQHPWAFGSCPGKATVDMFRKWWSLERATPRMLTPPIPEGTKDRLARLGNAVVPAVSMAVWGAILAESGIGPPDRAPSAEWTGGIWAVGGRRFFGVPLGRKFPRAGLVASGCLWPRKPVFPKRWGIRLSPTVERFPTPRVSDKGGPEWKSVGAMDAALYNPRLSSIVATGRGRVRTPTSWDGMNPGHRDGGDIDTRSRLNPEWVEWLMGFPVGWTDPEC